MKTARLSFHGRRLIGVVREEMQTLIDRVQITRLDGALPRWHFRELILFTSQLRYALRASEEQIQEAIKLELGQQMFLDVRLG